MKGLLIYISDLIEKVWDRVKSIETFKWIWAEAKKFQIAISELTISIYFQAFKQNFKIALLTLQTTFTTYKFKFVDTLVSLATLIEGFKTPKRENLLTIKIFDEVKKFFVSEALNIIPRTSFMISKIKTSTIFRTLSTLKDARKLNIKMRLLSLIDNSEASKIKSNEKLSTLQSNVQTIKTQLIRNQTTILSYAIVEKHKDYVIIPPPQPIIKSVSTPDYLLILR